jgi:hypothetical protein
VLAGGGLSLEVFEFLQQPGLAAGKTPSVYHKDDPDKGVSEKEKFIDHGASQQQ